MFDLAQLVPASRQCLQVVATDWSATCGQAQCLARGGDGWQPVGTAFPVMLGRHGLAWGRGVHGPAPSGVAEKQEGDGRAPVGVFAITALFGRAPNPGELGFRLPYHRVRPSLKAVDDPASRYYNQIVDSAALTPDWSSAEDMLRADARYDLGAVLACNTDPVLPGKGSCLFLHVWAAPGVPTAGCTAMAYSDMLRLARWLDPSAQPVLCQTVADS